MSAEQNRAIVSRFYNELWNERKLDVADEIFASDCVTHQLQSGAEAVPAVRNPESVKRHVSEWLDGFPDLHFTVEQMLSEGDRVVSQCVMDGTHTGAWQGISPTGKRVSVRLFVIHYIEDGKIAKDWVLVEALGFFQQLGLLPSSEEIFSQ